MPDLLAIAPLLLIAAITPGPNNAVMMRTGARRGVGGSLPALCGVLLGGTTMLALTVVGTGELFTRWPLLRTLLAVGGGLYLVQMGLGLLRDHGKQDESALPAGIVGLFVFQFLNPKAWLMLLTVEAALPAAGALQAFARLAPLFCGICAACLLMWSAAGRFLALALNHQAARRGIDRVLGVSLIVSALLLFH